MSEEWRRELKVVHLCFFVIALLAADFTLAQTAQTQQNTGAAGADVGSANYQMKTAVGEPGAGRSQSTNYIYDHGTTWSGSATSTSPSLRGGGGTGGGGGTSGGSGGSGGGGGDGGGISSFVVSGSGGGSGSGIGGGIPDELGVGGVSPTVDEAMTEEVTELLPKAETVVIPEKKVIPYIKETLQTNFRKPRIIQITDEHNVVRGVVILLLRRVMPWPLWLAFLFLIIGTGTLARVRRDGLWHRENVWFASGLIIAGLTLGWVTRSLYRIDPTSLGINAMTTALTVQPVNVKNAVQDIVRKKSIGVHRVTVINGDGAEIMKITIFVKGTLIL